MASRIALAGNPNCGKTTLFNALTGSSQYVGNWPGVTVEKKEGTYTHDKTVVVTRYLPGIYSLSPYSPEEIVSRDYLIDERPDVVIDVVDATNLERNLYLTAQILDLGLPVVVALNMADLVRKSGDVIDKTKLSATLGCPVVETSALKGEGIDELMSAAVAAAKSGAVPEPRMRFDEAVEEALCRLEAAIGRSAPARLGRWYAIKLLEGEQRSIEALKPASDTLDMAAAIRRDLEERFDDDAESIVTAERYDAIAHAVDETVVKSRKGMSLTQKIDRIVTNRWLGLPIFVLVMTFVYFIAVSTVGHVATDWANDGVFGDGWQYTQDLFIPGIPTYIDAWLTSIDCAPWLQSLILDGIVAGVGAVLGFVPQMIVLFLMLSFLEGCGYMARVAFIMDRIFRKFGLSGKSFIPMLIASGCGVPAIMATKTIENERDRRMTIMTTTMIPCGAKLPIIALVFGALAGQVSDGVWWIAPLFYFMGVAAIVVSGIMLRKTRMFAGEPTPFVMELPQYHLPTARSVFAAAWERVKSFIVKAGTVIFLASIVILGAFEPRLLRGDLRPARYRDGRLHPIQPDGDARRGYRSCVRAAGLRRLAVGRHVDHGPGRQGERGFHRGHHHQLGRCGRGRRVDVAGVFGHVRGKRPCNRRFLRVQPAVRSVLRRHRHDPPSDGIGEMDVVRHRLHDRVRLRRRADDLSVRNVFATGAFGWGTAAASVVLAALLFQLFRPMPDYRDGKRTEASAVLQRA